MGQYGELREKLLHKETEEADHRRGKKMGKQKKRRHKQGSELKKAQKMLLAAIAVRVLGLSNVSL